ncbi:MAG TPA: hypothetical protein PK625_00960, partial [Spirochaetales bacterium]|nr:hypothetical protein [Spirochaetales bacterium]
MPDRNRLPSNLSLVIVLSFASLILLVLLRFLVAGRFSQGFLVWNLILAAVLVGCAQAGRVMAQRHEGTR